VAFFLQNDFFKRERNEIHRLISADGARLHREQSAFETRIFQLVVVTKNAAYNKRKLHFTVAVFENI
jgi:hypothetical protein